jgi:transcriptional regulator with XRE-family HTH domain
MKKTASRQADVAKAAGVSQSTVSMVMNGTADLGRISAGTQRRVMDAARRLHTFEPIFPTSSRDYYFEFLRGIEEQAAAEGCNLVLFTAAPDESGVRRIFADDTNGLRQAAGSLLLGHHADREDLARLAYEGYPFVYVGHREVPGASAATTGPRPARSSTIWSRSATGRSRISASSRATSRRRIGGPDSPGRWSALRCRCRSRCSRLRPG